MKKLILYLALLLVAFATAEIDEPSIDEDKLEVPESDDKVIDDDSFIDHLNLRSLGNGGVEEASSRSCRDKDQDCAFYARRNYCNNSRYRTWMRRNCRKSCKICSGTTSKRKLGLADGCPKGGRSPRSKEMSSKSKMLAKGAVRCCSKNGKTCVTPKPCMKTTLARAQARCAKMGRRICTAEELTKNKCCGTGCGYDSNLTWYTGKAGKKNQGPARRCRDNNRNCRRWARRFCNSRNYKRWMRRNCRRSCRRC